MAGKASKGAEKTGAVGPSGGEGEDACFAAKMKPLKARIRARLILAFVEAHQRRINFDYDRR